LPPSLVQKIQRQAGPRPVHRDQLALADSVIKAVFNSGPPKAMLVVTRSPVGTCSTILPSGAITEMQPEIRVATQMLPGSFHCKRVEHLVAAEASDRLAAFATIDHVAWLDDAGSEIS